MAKKTFVTVELRESVGQCVKVSDAVMMQNGIERMGTCGACGHAIKNECGIRTPAGSLMWVGGCCEKVLCKPDARETVAAGSRWNDGTRDLVSLTDTEYQSLLGIAYQHAADYDGSFGTDSNEYQTRRFTRNQFVASILENIARFSPVERIVTRKQYDALMKNL